MKIVFRLCKAPTSNVLILQPSRPGFVKVDNGKTIPLRPPTYLVWFCEAGEGELLVGPSSQDTGDSPDTIQQAIEMYNGTGYGGHTTNVLSGPDGTFLRNLECHGAPLSVEDPTKPRRGGNEQVAPLVHTLRDSRWRCLVTSLSAWLTTGKRRRLRAVLYNETQQRNGI